MKASQFFRHSPMFDSIEIIPAPEPDVTRCDQCGEAKPTQLVIDEDRGVGYIAEVEICEDCRERRRRQS